MASKTNKPQLPTLDELVDHWPTFLGALEKEPDVSVALLIGSYIDSLLYGLLESRFASETKAAWLLETDGPLGNSFRRAAMAYCIGLISGEELNLIQQICGIRNDFAHGWKERLVFESDNIAEKCGALEYSDKWIPTVAGALLRKPSGSPAYTSLRDRFIHVSWALLVGIFVSRVIVRPGRFKPYRPQGNEHDGT